MCITGICHDKYLTGLLRYGSIYTLGRNWLLTKPHRWKRFIALVLSVALFSGFSMEAKAAPASGLTKVEITDLTVDDYGEIHVEVKFTSTEF